MHEMRIKRSGLLDGFISATHFTSLVYFFGLLWFTLVNFHDYCGKNKDDPSPKTFEFTPPPPKKKKMVGISLVYLNFVDSLSLILRKTV